MQNKSILIGVGLLFAVIGVIAYSGLIEICGRYIPQDNLLLDYAQGVTWAILLGLSIVFWPVPSKDRALLRVGWLGKTVMTLVLMLPYEYYYDTDAFRYFYGSKLHWWTWEKLTLGEGSTNLAQLAWLHGQVFPDSYHWMKVSFAFVGFVALYLCYKAACQFLEREEPKVFYALVFFPSMLFWSSTLGKDPIILLGISIYLFGVAAWYRTNNPLYIALAMAGVWETMTIRIWMGAILVAPLFVFAIIRLRNMFAKLAVTAIVGAVFLFAAGRFGERFNIDSTQDILQSIDAQARNTGWEGGSGQQITFNLTNPVQLALFLPLGAFTALFRPLPGEILNPFGLLAGFENALLLWILYQGWKRTRWREIKDPKVLWAITLILTWSTIYGVISYQNLGAASRFRLQILPVLLGTLLYLRRDRTAEAPEANRDRATVDGFGDEWSRFDQSVLSAPEAEEAFQKYFRIFPWAALPKDARGFDLGCGSGRWAKFVAPRVGILHCVDASSAALAVAKKNLAGNANVELHHASVESIPIKDGSMDFGYSLGVLHHVPDTMAGLRSCVAKLKPGAPFLLYLYYSMDNRPAWYRGLWKGSDLVRRVVSKAPHPVRYFLSQVLAASVYFPAARTAAVLERMGVRVENLPLAFYRRSSYYTMRTDALDRFGTRLEQRFSRNEISAMMGKCGLVRIRFSESMPHWVSLGFKKA